MHLLPTIPSRERFGDEGSWQGLTVSINKERNEPYKLLTSLSTLLSKVGSFQRTERMHKVVNKIIKGMK